MLKQRKKCASCNRVLPLDSFRRTTLVVGGYYIYCLHCSDPKSKSLATGKSRFNLAFDLLDSDDSPLNIPNLEPVEKPPTETSSLYEDLAIEWSCSECGDRQPISFITDRIFLCDDCLLGNSVS